MCDSAIGHACQNAVFLTGESAWNNNRTLLIMRFKLLMIFSHCQTVSMTTARFRPPKTEEEEVSLLSETVPKNTKYNIN